MTSTHRQEDLVKTLRNRLEETIELHPQLSGKKVSENLSLLFDSPYKWLRMRHREISAQNQNYKDSEILQEEVLKLISEVKEVYGIEILPKME
jgi:hypothetical protein